VDWSDLTAAQRDEFSNLFDKEISPVLTPLSLDAAHPFPYVSNLSTSWAFRLEDPVSSKDVLVRVKMPSKLPQWVRVRAGVESPERVYVGLHQVIAANAERLFPGMVIWSASLFRVCRDAQVELVEHDTVVSKRALVEREILQRRFEPVVRLEVQPDADPAMVTELMERFALRTEDVYEMGVLLDYTTLFEIAGLEIEPLRYPRWAPLPRSGSIASARVQRRSSPPRSRTCSGWTRISRRSTWSHAQTPSSSGAPPARAACCVRRPSSKTS
jgi:polyphosphate kinase